MAVVTPIARPPMTGHSIDDLFGYGSLIDQTSKEVVIYNLSVLLPNERGCIHGSDMLCNVQVLG